MSPVQLGKNPRDEEPRFAVPATGLFLCRNPHVISAALRGAIVQALWDLTGNLIGNCRERHIDLIKQTLGLKG